MKRAISSNNHPANNSKNRTSTPSPPPTPTHSSSLRQSQLRTTPHVPSISSGSGSGSGSPSASASQKFIQSLLDVRRNGAPPFLVRNLRYVHEHKSPYGRVWDLSWASTNNPRAAYTRRHLKISLHPTNCVVSKQIAQKLSPHTPFIPRLATLHISLLIQQTDGRNFSFSIRRPNNAPNIRVWYSEKHPDPYVRDELPFNTTFDFSSFLPLLTAPMAKLSLVAHLSFPDDLRHNFHGASSSASSSPHPPFSLLGLLIIWQAGHPLSQGTAILSQSVTIPLCYSRSLQPPMDLEPKGIPVIRLGEEFKFDSKSGRIDASIQIRINGQVYNHIQSIMEQADKPRILVTVRYESSVLPWHDITRHDFICPWCHRNCHRFRSLLTHLQVDHDDYKFSLQGVASALNRLDKGQAPFTVLLNVTPINARRGNEDTNGNGNTNAQQHQQQSNNRRFGLNRNGNESDDYEETNFINPRGYPNLFAAAQRAHVNTEMAARMNQVTLDSPTDSDIQSTVSTVNETEQASSFPAMIRESLWNFCNHCGRRHDRSYNGKDDFCSEWCEIVYANERRKDQLEEKPLLSLASTPRERKINYKETFGKLDLFHLVTVSEMKEGHYDEDDPDSEEEVDQSWRLDLNIERVRGLKDVDPKEKIFWMLWNKFGHVNYPIPCLYGERYTRYSCELFVLDYRAEIIRLRLRLQLFGFLKALHIHGLLDGPAIISVMQCLDGKKKRRDIAISARPELPLEKKTGIAGAGKRGRAGASKRKNVGG